VGSTNENISLSFVNYRRIKPFLCTIFTQINKIHLRPPKLTSSEFLMALLGVILKSCTPQILLELSHENYIVKAKQYSFHVTIQGGFVT